MKRYIVQKQWIMTLKCAAHGGHLHICKYIVYHYNPGLYQVLINAA